VSVFRWIAAEKASHSIKTMCRVLGVSRSGFHAWEHRPPSDRALTDAWLIEKIREAHAESLGSYGERRIHVELREEHDIRIGRKRVQRLMAKEGLRGAGRRARRRTTISVPGVAPAEDLVNRDFNPQAPNLLWSADFTYIPTGEGWLYLAGVLDCFSRRLVGWSMACHMREELVTDALEMAVARRRPGEGLIHHSDRGSQYTAVTFGRGCRDAGIALSMGSKGDCFDNAVIEAFWASLKKEIGLTTGRKFATRAQARAVIFEYIETFYNPRRRHSTLAYRSPVEHERLHAAGALTPVA
jgi:transposase InsO family protein